MQFRIARLIENAALVYMINGYIIGHINQINRHCISMCYQLKMVKCSIISAKECTVMERDIVAICCAMLGCHGIIPLIN